MKLLKLALAVLAAAFVIIQFFRPEKNDSPVDPAREISAAVDVPEDVSAILRTSCYDCHSNSTRYPWYAEVQPGGWYLADHIKEGKEHLNFSEFAAGSLRRQYHKLEEVSEQLNLGEMPLSSYLILHRDAVLSDQQKARLNQWVEESRAAMRAKYPIDSLERKRNGGPGGPGGNGERPRPN